ncbi:MAG: ABC transporter transmembrane domain-containing protein [Verrucomicrobiales bacterium]
MALAWRHWPQYRKLVLLRRSALLGLVSLGGAGLAIDYSARRWSRGTCATALSLLVAACGLAAHADALVDWLRMDPGGVGAQGSTFLANTSPANWLGQARIVVELRAQVFRRMQQLGFRFFDANATGSLINRVTGDTQSCGSSSMAAMQSLNVLG